ncbi:MAG TPA: CDP-diacylglycerol--serine O-phosphatidyltransferase [Burkholderiales bacterium]|nr:CDP-diacylglycerol--serine O-phosphatidyltransferase [Burkholderiales bacterium]
MADAPDDEEIEALSPGKPAPLGGLRRRGIYLLPNLFTTGVLFCGFFAIVQAMNGRFETGCIAIFVAMVLDGMDGRVARWTNTQSEFGAQFDSIADMVAFGAAPALVAYTWALKDFGTLGWIGAFIYCAGTGIRLARFNANISVVDKRYFQGLPSPSGAAVMAGLVWALTDLGFEPEDSFWLGALTWTTAVFAGITMVSNVPFWSFKEVNWKKRVPLWVILAGVIALSIIASSPSLILFGLFMCYALSGYVMWAMGHRVRPVLPEE